MQNKNKYPGSYELPGLSSKIRKPIFKHLTKNKSMKQTNKKAGKSTTGGKVATKSAKRNPLLVHEVIKALRELSCGFDRNKYVLNEIIENAGTYDPCAGLNISTKEGIVISESTGWTELGKQEIARAVDCIRKTIDLVPKIKFEGNSYKLSTGAEDEFISAWINNKSGIRTLIDQIFQLSIAYVPLSKIHDLEAHPMLEKVNLWVIFIKIMDNIFIKYNSIGGDHSAGNTDIKTSAPAQNPINKSGNTSKEFVHSATTINHLIEAIPRLEDYRRILGRIRENAFAYMPEKGLPLTLNHTTRELMLIWLDQIDEALNVAERRGELDGMYELYNATCIMENNKLDEGELYPPAQLIRYAFDVTIYWQWQFKKDETPQVGDISNAAALYWWWCELSWSSNRDHKGYRAD